MIDQTPDDRDDYVIDARNVDHTFKSSNGQAVFALQNVNLKIRRHEFISLIGPSGCGKSTFLRLIAGLLSPTDGQVAIDGVPLKGASDQIGIVFQRPTLLSWLNVLQNVTFPMKHQYGTVDAMTNARAAKLLELVGLQQFATKMPDELSGGMQQRVAIARSLLHDPEIMLMDEPFSALDALTRDEMSFELLRICREKPKTVVFVTHSITEALLLSDRIAVFDPRPGRIRQVLEVPLPRPRTPDTLYQPRFYELAQQIREIISNRQAQPH